MPYAQNGPFRVDSSNTGYTLLFSALYGEEAVSAPYVFTLDVVSEMDTIDGSDLLRQPLVVEMDIDGGGTRYIHGLVRKFSELDVIQDEALYGYRVELVPWLWFLSLASDCRVYENKSVLDIVEDVFKRNNWTDFRSACTGSYPEREYCVQYRETDLAFVSRLLEEEGIFYFFEHTESKHTLVLADSNSAFQKTAGPSSVSSVTRRVGQTDYQNSISDLRMDQQVPAGTVTLYDYNYMDGQTPLKSTNSSTGPDEMYDYPAGFADQSTGDRYARVRLDAEEAVVYQLTGVGTCRGFTSGYQFSISDYWRSDLNQSYNIARVRHTASLGAYVAAGAGTQSAKYVNDFTAIPDNAVYRPQVRTPRPAIHGTQTALVVGPSGSEINVDKYGRVQVQFFWERADKGDPGSSIYVRVATFWAGKQWGAIHIPRIGQEVVVAFEEGNPDRPIIVGSVYNPDMMPPYDLPANKSQSGIKSRSTEGGGTSDYNEFRFEDKKGSEQIVMHAQKDYILEVENARTETIGNTDSRTVTKGDDTVEIKDGDQIITVYGKRQVNARDRQLLIVHGDDVIQIKEAGGYDMTIAQGDHTTELQQGDMDTQLDLGNWALGCDIGNIDVDASTGNISIKAELGQITIEAMQGITLQCGENSIQITPTGIQISGMMVSVQGQIQTQVSGLMTQLSGSVMTQISGGITMIG